MNTQPVYGRLDKNNPTYVPIDDPSVPKPIRWLPTVGPLSVATGLTLDASAAFERTMAPDTDRYLDGGRSVLRNVY